MCLSLCVCHFLFENKVKCSARLSFFFAFALFDTSVGTGGHVGDHKSKFSTKIIIIIIIINTKKTNYQLVLELNTVKGAVFNEIIIIFITIIIRRREDIKINIT